MSDHQPSWMPSEGSILDAAKGCVELVSIGELGATDGIRALIASAVAKALAEQEARHRREVLEARIHECEEYGDCICERYSDPTLNVRHQDCEVCKHLDSLRAELAALDKGGE